MLLDTRGVFLELKHCDILGIWVVQDLLCVSYSLEYISQCLQTHHMSRCFSALCWRILNRQNDILQFTVCVCSAHISTSSVFPYTLPWPGLLSPEQLCRASRGPVASCPQQEDGQQVCPSLPWSLGIAPPSSASLAPHPAQTAAWFAPHSGRMS